MANGTVTIRAVEALATAGLPVFLWDGEVKGFGVKATRSGVKTYVYQYRLGGRGAKTKRFTIGRHGSITPDEARKRAKRLAATVLEGVDPAEAKRKQREDRINLAFNAYGATFLERELAQRSQGFQVLAEGILRLHVYPVLRDKPLPAVTRADMVALFDALPMDKPALRRNSFAVLRRLFNWAVSRGDVPDSPLRGFAAPPAVASRDHVLSDDEISLTWRAASTLGYPFGPLVQLLFATGQRREEVAALDWSELDRLSRLWTLPAARAKNGKPHRVPLNALAIAILDSATKRTGEEAEIWPRKGPVFTTTGRTTVSGYSRAKDRLDAAMLAILEREAMEAGGDASDAAIMPWRLHDARRTLATGLQRLGVRFEVTEAVLNHISGSKSGIAAVYQRHDWAEEKRAALDAWGQFLGGLFGVQSSGNVLRFRRAARLGGRNDK